MEDISLSLRYIMVYEMEEKKVLLQYGDGRGPHVAKELCRGTPRSSPQG